MTSHVKIGDPNHFFIQLINSREFRERRHQHARNIKYSEGTTLGKARFHLVPAMFDAIRNCRMPPDDKMLASLAADLETVRGEELYEQLMTEGTAYAEDFAKRKAALNGNGEAESNGKSHVLEFAPPKAKINRAEHPSITMIKDFLAAHCCMVISGRLTFLTHDEFVSKNNGREPRRGDGVSQLRVVEFMRSNQSPVSMHSKRVEAVFRHTAPVEDARIMLTCLKMPAEQVDMICDLWDMSKTAAHAVYRRERTQTAHAAR